MSKLAVLLTFLLVSCSTRTAYLTDVTFSLVPQPLKITIRQFAKTSSDSLFTVVGSIQDSITQEVLIEANIFVNPRRKFTRSDGLGRFSIDSMTTRDTILFKYIGYSTKAIFGKNIEAGEIY